MPKWHDPDKVLRASPGDWVVRIKRRRDGRKYYFRHDGCTTGRKDSSLRMSEDVAVGLARAIASQHPDFTAWAIPYNATRSEHIRRAADASRATDSLQLPVDDVTCAVVPEGSSHA